MATTPEFKYAPMFQLGKDTTEYRLIGKEGVSTGEFEGKTILKVSKEALTQLAQQAFHDVEFMLRREHNLQVAKILSDPEASENDKYVALQFLRNAETAVRVFFPSAKIRVRLLSMAKRGSVCGPTSKTKRHSALAFITLIHKTTFAIHKMHRSICTMR